MRFFRRKVCSPEDKAGSKKKRTTVARIANLIIVGTGLVDIGALAEEGTYYDLSGVWKGTFANGQASPQPYL